jgi:hypothetical protein
MSEQLVSNPSTSLAMMCHSRIRADKLRELRVYGAWHNDELIMWGCGRRSAVERWAHMKEWGYRGPITVTYLGRI